MTAARYAVVDFPAPPAWESPCLACGGAGVVGDLYEMATDGPTLLVEVLCPRCGGCGNGDPGHHACDPKAHADWDPDDLDEDLAEQVEVCWSCRGRGWNAVQGFTGDVVDEDFDELLGCTLDDLEDSHLPTGDSAPLDAPAGVTVLRVPCGCMADRVRLLPAAEDGAGS